MDDLDCPTTYHLGKSLRLRETPYEPREGGMNKPLGLWTAPGRLDADGGLKTAWSDRHVIEYGDEVKDNLYAITPQPGAVVLRLGTDDDLRALGAAFPRFHAGTSGWNGQPSHDDRVTAWKEVEERTGVDGVLITDALARTAHSGTYSLDKAEDPVLWGMYDALSTWDVGSACWFRTDHVEVSKATLGSYPAVVKHVMFDRRAQAEKSWHRTVFTTA